MSQPGPGSGQLPVQWIYDPIRQQYYYFNARTNEYVYQNGTRIPVANITPRTTGQQRPPLTGEFSGSPPTDPHYVHNQPRQPYSQPPDLPAALNSLNLNPPPSAPAAPPPAASRPGVRQYDYNGLQVVDAEDPRSLVRNRFATAPVDRITDPELFGAGIHAHRMLYSTGDEPEERLYTQYRLRGHDFFRFGRVFLILWSEPAGEASGSAITSVEASDRSISQGPYGQRVHSKVRRFIVIREGRDYCSACPIATYGSRGVSKPGVTKSDHAIIYTGRSAPQPKVHEGPLRGEAGMRPIPIRIVPDEPTNTLDPMSRVDFGKIHTIQHNVKVRPYGLVHPDSQAALATQFGNVWRSTLNFVPDQPAEPGRTAASASSAAPSSTPGSTTAPRAVPSRNPVPSSSRRVPPSRTIPEEDNESDEPDDDDDDDDDEDEDDDEGDGKATTQRRGGRDNDSDDGAGSASRTDASSRRQGYQTQLSSSATAQARSTSVSASSSRAPAGNNPRASSTSSSGSDGQPTWSTRAQGAQAAYRRLLDTGYSKDQAFAALVNQRVQQGSPVAAARAEIQAYLSGRPPT